LFYRQIRGLRPIENFCCVNAEPPMTIKIVRAIADESTGGGIRASIVDRGNGTTCRKCDDLIAATIE
jgi:hypothetical protein